MEERRRQRSSSGQGVVLASLAGGIRGEEMVAAAALEKEGQAEGIGDGCCVHPVCGCSALG